MDFFSTDVLNTVVANTLGNPQFLIDRYFGTVQTETSEEIHFDVLDGKRRIAPFVSPLVEGQITAQAQAHGIPKEEVAQKIMLPGCPLGRLLEPEEVAQTVLYLCSGAAAGMTGAALPLDGGWTAQ